MTILSPAPKSVIVSCSKPRIVSLNVSLPGPPVSVSEPMPPVSTLATSLPMIRSLPLPPIAFSMIVPRAMLTLPVLPGRRSRRFRG